MSENKHGWTTAVIRQDKTSADCVACVAAMSAGTTVADFKQWCGQEVGPFSDLTVIAYLLAHGVQMGTGFALSGADEGVRSVEFVWEARGHAAYLGVKSRIYEGVGHAVFWNGEHVLDPQEQESQPMTDYHVEVVWPLTRLPTQEAPDPRRMVEVPQTRTAAMEILELQAALGQAMSVLRIDAPEGEPPAIAAKHSGAILLWEEDAPELFARLRAPEDGGSR